MGIYNHKFFLLFVLYTFLQCGYSLLLVVARFFSCTRAGLEDGGCSSLGILTALVLLEAIMFGLFTMCMLCDQCSVLTTNETKIDRLKGEKHAAPTIVNEIFGSASTKGWLCTYGLWLMPFPVVFPGSIKDQVLGFEVPPQGFPHSGSPLDGADSADAMERDVEMGPAGPPRSLSELSGSETSVSPNRTIDARGDIEPHHHEVEVVEMLKDPSDEELGLLLRPNASANGGLRTV